MRIGWHLARAAITLGSVLSRPRRSIRRAVGSKPAPPGPFCPPFAPVGTLPSGGGPPKPPPPAGHRAIGGAAVAGAGAAVAAPVAPPRGPKVMSSTARPSSRRQAVKSLRLFWIFSRSIGLRPRPPNCTPCSRSPQAFCAVWNSSDRGSIPEPRPEPAAGRVAVGVEGRVGHVDAVLAHARRVLQQRVLRIDWRLSCQASSQWLSPARRPGPTHCCPTPQAVASRASDSPRSAID